MKVKLTTSLSGTNGAWNAGDEYECGDSEARSLIEAGFAVPIATEKRETATKKTTAKETR